MFQGEALKETRKALPKSKSLIGFVGGPWTLFSYAVAGKIDNLKAIDNLKTTDASKATDATNASKATDATKPMQPTDATKASKATDATDATNATDAQRDAKTSLPLLSPFNEILLPLLEKNIALQLESGAELVMIFDTSAGNLSPFCFREFVYPALSFLTSRFPHQLGYYTKACSSEVLAQVASLDFAGLGLDHRFELSKELQSPSKPKKGFLQGNFDPSLMLLKKKEFEWQVRKYLEPFQKMSLENRRGWVCGLGHGVLPPTPEENVKCFIKWVREVF